MWKTCKDMWVKKSPHAIKKICFSKNILSKNILKKYTFEEEKLSNNTLDDDENDN